ncbi:MAG: L-threonylcarbamoyladenylate synthase, partial [Patescibacteria group bacterium]|nr:L-threonylcarbamoyladenylate synthase [Patescibacteria group bacterium]
TVLKNGDLVVLPTDTIYGIVAVATNISAVQKLDTAKQRPDGYPYIILISSIDELSLFGVYLDQNIKSTLEKIWPAPVSIVLKTNHFDSSYLGATDSLAFRLPNSPKLLELIKKTGPLVAPSANTSGQPTATTIAKAQDYFGQKVSLYIPAETEPLVGQASTLVDFTSPSPKILRAGTVKLDNLW